jgi:hypothetical protein
MEDSAFSNPSALMDQFNQIQQMTAGPSMSINQTKELAGNMLLTMGVPFFGERLKKHLGDDVVEQLKKYASGELNMDDALKFAKNQFQDKILPQAKQTLLSEANKYIPGLDGLDLENASINDVKNFFQQKVTQKLKSALPDELANALPENFTQADILNKVRTLGSDQALAYAKKTLPPDVYNELEANQDVISNPSRIAGFINSKLAETKGNLTRLASTTQQQAEQQLAALKGQMIDKANETLSPLRDKVNNLKQLRQDAQDKFNQTTEELQSKYEDAQAKLGEFRAANPNATQEELQPFKDAIRSVQSDARSIRDEFTTGDTTFGEQLDAAQGMLKSNTDLLASKLTNLRTNIQQGLSSARQSAEETAQGVRTTLEDARASVPIPAAEEGEGIFSQFSTWAKGKIKQFTDPITRRAEDMAQTDSGFRPRLMQADEPENPFSEPALTFRNPGLETYYGSELDNPASLILNSPDSRVLIRGYKAAGRSGRYAAKPQEQAAARPAEGAQGGDQLAPMREMMDRQRQQQQAGQQQEQVQRESQTTTESLTPDEPAAAPAPSTSSLAEPAARPVPSEIEPVPTTAQSAQPLSEPIESVGSQLESESENIINTAKAAAEGVGKTVSSIGSKVTEGLDTAAAATEEIPVLDILMDVGGLIGSILGGTSLLGGKKPAPPAISGATFEPNL